MQLNSGVRPPHLSVVPCAGVACEIVTNGAIVEFRCQVRCTRAFLCKTSVPTERYLTMTTLRSCALVLLAALGVGHPVAAQSPAPSVGLSFGVDTTLPVVRDITRLVRAYLARPDSSAHTRGLWRVRTRAEARLGDPAQQAYQGFPATIVGVSGVGQDESLYVVKVLHASADSGGTLVRPLALQRFDVVRAPSAPFGWQLASPLPRLTRAWAHATYGRVTFWYAPGIRPDPPRARRAATFVDSLARLFAVAAPAHLDAYLTATTEDGERALGIDFFPEGSGPGTGLGGRSLPAASVLLLGDPGVGEAYLHEFVHAVLQPTLGPANYLSSEGIAVWLGGSRGKSPRTLYEELVAYQASYPTLTLDQVIRSDAPGGARATGALYATVGLIVEAIYRRGGIASVRQFATLEEESSALLARLAEFVGPVGTDISAWWRAEAAAAARR
jgi:hypothetical protein